MPFSCTAKISGRSAICGQTCCRDQRRCDGLCRTLFCRRRSVLATAEAVPQPGSVRQLYCRLRVRARRSAQPAGILQTTAGGAQVGRGPGLPRFAPAPVLCPASARVQPFFSSGQPAQSALSAAVATVGGSGSLPVILRPDERFLRR